MREAIFGDLHLDTRNGDIRFINFIVQYMKEKLREARAQGCTRFTQVGDSLDNRKRTSSAAVSALVEIIDYAVDELKFEEVVFLVGNHNTYYTDTNSTHNLIAFKGRDRVSIVENYQAIGDTLYLGWICPDNIDAISLRVSEAKEKYCFGHFAFTGFDMYKGIPAKGGFSPVPFRKFERTISGHYHTISEDGSVIYTGSPYHLNWSDYQDGLNRGWFLLDHDTDEFKLFQNTADDSLFAELFYDESKTYQESDIAPFANRIVKVHAKEVTDDKKYQKFVKLLKGFAFIDIRIIDYRETKVIESAIDLESIDADPNSVIETYMEELAVANGFVAERPIAILMELHQSAIRSL